jgi:hypothetical protein
MNPRRILALATAIAAAALLRGATPALACSVCFGAPDSPMAKGLASGILALVAITYTVLAGFVGVAIFWSVRARRLGRKTLATPTLEPGT